MNDPYSLFIELKKHYFMYINSRFALRHGALAAERQALLDADRQLYREPFVEVVPPYLYADVDFSALVSDLRLPEELTKFAPLGLFKFPSSNRFCCFAIGETILAKPDQESSQYVSKKV
jgi:hypothetical protein